MKVWHDSIYDTGIAKTKGGFDPINANASQIKIANPAATALLGFYVGYAPTALADGERIPNLILRVTSKALGISQQEIVIPQGGNDADANSGYVPMKTVFVPFKEPHTAQKLFNADLIFEASANATTTNGLDVVVCAVYADFEPDSIFAMELMAQQYSRVTGGVASADASKAHATGGTAVTLSTLSIPTGVTMLKAILAKVDPNGIAAGDPVTGIMELQSSGIPDFSPQKIPLCVFWAPAIGTVTDGLNSVGDGRYYPTRFELTGAETTINVSSTLLVAQGTAPDTHQAILYE